jgi:DNA-binding response OmpR family regulator
MSIGATLNTWMTKFAALGEAAPSTHDCEPGEGVVVGDIRLEHFPKVAYLRGTRLDLTPAEFDLLRYLLTHDRSIVTARTVLSTTKPDFSGVRQVKFLETLLSLKMKLAAAAPGACYIRTEPWVLYSFSPSRRTNDPEAH